MRKRLLAATGAALAGLAGLAWWRWRPEGGDLQNLPVARHEERDVGFRPMAIAFGLTLLGLAAAAGVALWIYPNTPADKSLPQPMPQFPQPVLQDNVAADYGTMHAEQLGKLNGAYWMDRANNVVHVPIAQAMADVAREGIHDWPTAKERRK